MPIKLRRPNVLVQVFEPGRGLSGKFVRDRNGQPVELGTLVFREKQRNHVPKVGLNIVRDLIGRATIGTGRGFAPTDFAVGTDSTLPTDLDDALGTEVYRDVITARQLFDERIIFQLFLGVDDANGNNLTEAGLFDSPLDVSGKMLVRTTFTAIPKTVSVQVVITWEIAIATED